MDTMTTMGGCRLTVDQKGGVISLTVDRSTTVASSRWVIQLSPSDARYLAGLLDKAGGQVKLGAWPNLSEQLAWNQAVDDDEPTQLRAEPWDDEERTQVDCQCPEACMVHGMGPWEGR